MIVVGEVGESTGLGKVAGIAKSPADLIGGFAARPIHPSAS